MRALLFINIFEEVGEERYTKMTFSKGPAMKSSIPCFWGCEEQKPSIYFEAPKKASRKARALNDTRSLNLPVLSGVSTSKILSDPRKVFSNTLHRPS